MFFKKIKKPSSKIKCFVCEGDHYAKDYLKRKGKKSMNMIDYLVITEDEYELVRDSESEIDDIEVHYSYDLNANYYDDNFVDSKYTYFMIDSKKFATKSLL